MSPLRKKPSVAIDTVPLPEHTARGTLAKVRNTYVLKVKRRVIKFAASSILPAQELDRLAGKEVLVAFSASQPSNVVAITKWPRPAHVKCYWILCYVPVPELMRRIQDQVRTDLLNQMVKAGVIAPELGKEIKIGLQSRM